MINKSSSLFLVFLALILILCSSYYSFIYKSQNCINFSTNYIRYESAAEISQASDLILIATPKEDFSQRKHIFEYDSNKHLYDFYTLTDININKIIKAPENFTFYPSDTITIIEPISMLQEIDGLNIYKTENYTELLKNKKYILFLKITDTKCYGIINMNEGKFDLDEFQYLKNISNVNKEPNFHTVLAAEIHKMYQDFIFK